MKNLLICGPSFLSALFTRKAEEASMKGERTVYSLKVLPYRQKVLACFVLAVALLLGTLLLCAKPVFFDVVGILLMVAGAAAAVLLLAKMNNPVAVVRSATLKLTRTGERYGFDRISSCVLRHGKDGARTLDVVFDDDSVATFSSELVNFNYLLTSLESYVTIDEEGGGEPRGDDYAEPEETVDVQDFKPPVKADEATEYGTKNPEEIFREE